MAQRPEGTGPTEPSPDAIEQRQRPDGTYEPASTVAGDVDRPLSPDEIEQRQSLDGSTGDPWADVPTDGPISPDVIDQSLTAGDDDEEPRDA